VAKGFTVFKDRIWFLVDAASRRIAEASGPVQKAGYGTMKSVLWAGYYLPGSPLRPAAAAFSKVLGQDSAKILYREFANRFILALRRIERLRLGHLEETSALFRFPEREKLDAALARGTGVFIGLPHCHASIAMARGLAESYPLLLLVRDPVDEKRAKAMRVYYNNIGCELFDVRNSPPISVARSVVGALRKGKVVIGVTDRIKAAPSKAEPYILEEDVWRTEAFGQPIGAAGWPARFAGKCKAPIFAGMVSQSDEEIALHLSDPIFVDDQRSATQAWVTAFEEFFRKYPYDWGFIYDKFWSRAVIAEASRTNDK
jgi:KDO2-lipid IV(A) lauroyltransferase